jgi:tellurite resistance protein TehA-like permease
MTAHFVHWPASVERVHTRIPASFFSIVIGLSGFAGSWRAASQVWDLTPIPGEVLNGLAGVIWLFLGINFAVKWLLAHEEARAELNHPIQGLFVGLAGVATMLVALGGLPYSPVLATAILIPGLLATFGFALWKTGKLWQGGRDPEQSIPALYLPLVAGSFVTAIALGSLASMRSRSLPSVRYFFPGLQSTLSFCTGSCTHQSFLISCGQRLACSWHLQLSGASLISRQVLSQMRFYTACSATPFFRPPFFSV